MYHPSDSVHVTGHKLDQPRSWRDFSDAGFPEDSRGHSAHHHYTIGPNSARALAPAHFVDAPRNTSGCYDDICDYYGLEEDHPLRFYHPLWIRAI